MISKKALQLLLCDYQRTARYYTIYRTFKCLSSDDFTTILRLFAGRNYDYLLRLFQPRRYDYCWPLLAIGRKPEKRCGESRQWFRAARRAPCYWTVPPGGVCALTADRCQIVSRRACTVCDVLHRLIWICNRYAPLHPYIHYYNRAAVLTCTASGVAVVSGIGGGVALDGMPSGVTQAVYRRFVWFLYCVRWNGANQRKHSCKAL